MVRQASPKRDILRILIFRTLSRSSLRSAVVVITFLVVRTVLVVRTILVVITFLVISTGCGS